MRGKPKPIKVCLMNGGDQIETPWAEDLGPAPGLKGSRRVRLLNVPFLHAKPTWGDVIVVAPNGSSLLTWDRDGVQYARIASRIAEDGGRWAMILDYQPHADTPGKDAFRALARACGEHEIVCESGKPNRAFLAVQRALTDATVMTRLRAAELPCELVQVHPAPVKAKRSRAKKKH
jgi:hypothetical protein